MSLQELYEEEWTTPTCLPDEDIPPPPSAPVITWSERDWEGLQFFRNWCINNPEDFITKQVYRNYLSWYRTKSAVSN
jgi:hypothetical protein